MKRMLPLPEPVRHTLIDLFSRLNNMAQAKRNQASKNCLVRFYLGRKRFGSSRSGGSMFFSLRNFKFLF